MVNQSILRRKIGRVEEHLKRIKALPLQPLDSFGKDTITQDVLLFNLTQAIQNCIDIATHIVSDEAWGLPGTQREAFDLLGDNSVISKEQVELLVAMAGFRNRIVHEYEKINMDIVYEVWQKGVKDIESFCLSVVERFRL